MRTREPAPFWRENVIAVARRHTSSSQPRSQDSLSYFEKELWYRGMSKNARTGENGKNLANGLFGKNDGNGEIQVI